MKMKKKQIAILCIFACLIASAVIPAYAEVPEDHLMPLANYYYSASASLTISASGIATATGGIIGRPGVTTKTTVHLYLQRKENGAWVNVDDWISSNETTDTTLQENKAVTKGYTYRAKASCYAYCGKKYEKVICYSAEIPY